MNIKGFISRFSLALTLLAISLSATYTSAEKISTYVLTGILILSAIIVLIENIISKRWWKEIANIAEEVDVTYIAFGLGLILSGSKFVSGGWGWAGILLMLAGALSAGTGVGKLMGKGAHDVLINNAKIGIIVGCIIIVLSAVLFATSWNSIIQNPRLNIVSPALLLCYGLLFIIFGWKRLKIIKH
jgi:hypothetical protein